jgi:hypothetical protein
MATFAERLNPADDPEALPGPAKSWAKGEPIPADMPSADVGTPATAGDKATAGLANIQRQQMVESAKVYGGITSGIDKDMAAVEEARKHSGVEAGELKPWDADKEAAKRQTDPIAAFGSFGSVFGILASAFTHAPLESALNASAAAINAIKQGNAQDYDRAHKAWEENTKLALDKHKIQHEAYTDAITLLKTNMAAGEAKMRVLAARFGDQKTLMMLDNGMSKEVIELQAARQKLALQLEENLPKIQMANAQMSRLFALGYNPKQPTTQKSQEALMQFQQEQAKLKQMSHAWGTAGVQTPGRQQAQAIQERMHNLQEQAKAEGKTLTDDDAYSMATRQIKLETAVPTGSRIDELKGKINQVHLAKTTIGHIEDMLKKHNAITGLGGTVTRPAEVVTNIFGGDETDRKQFQRWVSELQEIAPRILLDSKGRPLSSEAGRVENIIAGLQFGDTTANTARAYFEFKKVLDQIEGGLSERIQGTPAAAAPAAPKVEKGWDAYPAVH